MVKEKIQKINYFLDTKLLVSETMCGDIGVVKKLNGDFFIALIDVPGHDTNAYKIAIGL